MNWGMEILLSFSGSCSLCIIIMKGSTNKKQFIKNKQQNKSDTHSHHVNKAMPPASTSPETLPALANLTALPKEQRTEYANNAITEMLQFLPGYIAKKEGSRVVQMLIKWADPKLRTAAFEELKSHWREMIRGKYSVFVLKQMVRSVNIPELVDSCEVLQSIYEAAVVLDTFVKHTATGDQIEAIKRRFLELLGSEDQKKTELIDNIVMKAVEQNYFHLTMSKFIFRHAIHSLVESERQRVLECLRVNLLPLIYDIEGVKLAFEVVNYSNTKDRKEIIKALKPEVASILDSGSSTAYMLLLKVLHETDDTVLLEKSVIRELLPYMPSLFEDKRVFNLVFSVFSNLNHNNNIMHKWEPKVKVTTCKKDHAQRMAEVRSIMLPGVLAAIQSRPVPEVLRHENAHKLVIGLLSFTCLGNSPTTQRTTSWSTRTGSGACWSASWRTPRGQSRRTSRPSRAPRWCAT